MIEIKRNLTGEVIYTHDGDSLIGADLRGVDLSYSDLRGVDLRGVDLRGANLRDTNLRGVDLSYSDLRGANLLGANLRDTNLLGATLRGANLLGATLRGAHLWGAQTSHRYITIGCIGREKRLTTYCFDTDTVWCGCFTGTLEEFATKVEETHKDNPQYLAEYRGAIAYIKSLQNQK